MSLNKIKTLGILGGGQLGRMSALAAAPLGIKCIFYDPKPDACAFDVTQKHFTADWENEVSLEAFAKLVDVISYEFENIPTQTVSFLSQFKPVHPGVKLLEIAQHRIKEKTFLNEAGIPTARFAGASSAQDVFRTLESWGQSKCVLKTCRFGYDGKGQTFFDKNEDDLEFAWRKLGSDDVIIEELIDFECEISVVIAADQHGNIDTYTPSLNEHKNHILSKSIAPAPIDQKLLDQAVEHGKNLARDVDLIGVMALEMFVTKDGRLLGNEIAPRTHNSGHWTQDGSITSQFENHVRAVCGLPLGSTEMRSSCEMINIIGEDMNDISTYLDMPIAKLHLYGKGEIRKGRKMAHVNILKD